jgi:hypothetical protein
MLALLAALTFSSCTKNRLKGTGPTVTENFSIENFDQVDLNIDAEVNYTYGADYSVEVNAQQNVLDKMRIERISNVLFLTFEDNINLQYHNQITINVTSPEFRGADISGSGCVNVRGSYTADIVSADVSGSGKIDIEDIVANRLNIDISGSGKITVLSGRADDVNSDISGSGKIYLENLEAKRVRTETTGSGRTNVWATESLFAEITGSGSVYYKGNPTVESNITGSGKLRQL